MARNMSFLDKGYIEEDEFHRKNPRREIYARQHSTGSEEKKHSPSIKQHLRHYSSGSISIGERRKAEKRNSKRRSNDRKFKLEGHNSEADLPCSDEKEPSLVESSLREAEGSLLSGNCGMTRSISEFSMSENTISTLDSALFNRGEFLIAENLNLAQSSTSFCKSTSCSSFGSALTIESAKLRQLHRRLEECEKDRSLKKKLYLENMDLLKADIPIRRLVGTSLARNLHKLSLSRNNLQSLPENLVQSLPSLKNLELTNCELTSLPNVWNLPLLRMLNLSHNKLDFPNETIFEGLPDLVELNMFGNKVIEIVIPRNSKTLRRLETLDLGYNNIHSLPDDLDRLKSLRTLKLAQNFIEKIPMHVCEMDLKTIDISGNNVEQPPTEFCEGGVSSMRDYYRSLREEKQSKHKKSTKQKHKKSEEMKWFGTLNAFEKTLTPLKNNVPTFEHDGFIEACKSRSITLKMITSFIDKYGKKALISSHSDESKVKNGGNKKSLIEYIYESKPSVEIIDYLLEADILDVKKKRIFNEFISYRNDLLHDKQSQGQICYRTKMTQMIS